MKLERPDLIKAIAFLKPAILVSDQPDPLEYVHVKTMGERCQFTAANHHFGKRVTLFRPQQLQFEEEEREPDQEFMIDKPLLIAYETLLSKHKGALTKAAKIDHTLNFVDIFPDTLESHKDVISYNQTKLKYPNLDRYFVEGNRSLDTLRFNYQFAIDALKEFPGNVDMTFGRFEQNDEIKEYVFMQTENGEYQAFFCPIIPRDA